MDALSDMRLRIRQHKPVTMRDALGVVLELESYQLASRQRAEFVRETQLENGFPMQWQFGHGAEGPAGDRTLKAPKDVFKTGSIYSGGDSLTVSSTINGRACEITVDTGSNISIVRPDARELGAVVCSSNPHQ